ncbi:hypothetical protein [Sphingomonas sp.]|uniref:hypothetical protein n=1 Tax=Sphingomonas sp. TaxID=28214 RepID=UPI0025F228C2|nr:hypothetical protein [Sphingomonas sp.]
MILMLGAALLGCAPAPGPAAGTGPGETVGLTIKSWGKPLFAWTLTPQGEGVFTYADEGATKDFRDYVLKTKRISAGRAGYAQVAKLLSPGRRYAGEKLPCERRITDMPYGVISWGAEPAMQVKYDLGCQSAATTPVYDGMKRAQDLMKGWADKEPVAETRPGGQ